MTTARSPRLRRMVERVLLARDRMEIAAAERLLAVLKVEARRKKQRARAR